MRRTSAPFKSLLSFGVGVNGALGHGSLDAVSSAAPRPVEAFTGEPLRAAASGWGHSAVVSAKGDLFVFGRTHDFRNTLRMGRLWRRSEWLARASLWLGTSASIDHARPARLGLCDVEGHSSVAENVKCGAGVTACVSETGLVYMLGNNRFGQCGVGTADRYVWEATPLAGCIQAESIAEVALGFQHAAAVTKRGEVFTWGKGERGQLGIGDDSEGKRKTVPEKLNPAAFGDEEVIDVACAFNSTVALTRSGKVFTWGKFQGVHVDQKGFNFVDAWTPREVVFPEEADQRIVQVMAGQFYFLAQDQTGALWMWGMIPDAMDAQQVKQRLGRSPTSSDKGQSVERRSGFVESGAERTIHTPVRVGMNVDEDEGDKVFIGFDQFYVKKGDRVVRLDWALSPVQLDLGVDHALVGELCPGWMHTLILLEDVDAGMDAS